jgi:hypothetical protein
MRMISVVISCPRCQNCSYALYVAKALRHSCELTCDFKFQVCVCLRQSMPSMNDTMQVWPFNRGVIASIARAFSETRGEIKHVLFSVVFDRVQLSASHDINQSILIITLRRFPLEIVFRIYDNCLANGIEAIFGFSVALLKKNEEALLTLKFDEILAFLSNKLLDIYKVCAYVRSRNQF